MYYYQNFPKIKYYFQRRRCDYHLSYLKNIFLILPYQPKWYPIQMIIPWFKATALTLKMHCVLQNIGVVVLWFLRFDLSHFGWNFWQEGVNANVPSKRLMTIFYKNCQNCLQNYICFVLETLIPFVYSVHDLKNVNKLQFYQIYYLKTATKLSKNAKLP